MDDAEVQYHFNKYQQDYDNAMVGIRPGSLKGKAAFL
jgi:hypothetical protein